MKVLAVLGSPRKMGNTYAVVQQIEGQLMSIDNTIDFEYLFLRDHDLKSCNGCFTCIAHGEDKCPLRDDLATIKNKLLEADGIIFAAPTYAAGVPALMKNFIDRLAYTLHRPCFFDKAFLAVATVGGVMGLKLTLEQLAILSAGGRSLRKLGVSVPPVPMRGIEKSTKKKIHRAAKAYYRSLQNQDLKLPGIIDWLYFYSFKAFSSIESYQAVCPADASYYGEKAEYFYPLKGHYIRRLTGKMIKGLMSAAMRAIIIK